MAIAASASSSEPELLAGESGWLGSACRRPPQARPATPRASAVGRSLRRPSPRRSSCPARPLHHGVAGGARRRAPLIPASCKAPSRARRGPATNCGRLGVGDQRKRSTPTPGATTHHAETASASGSCRSGGPTARTAQRQRGEARRHRGSRSATAAFRRSPAGPGSCRGQVVPQPSRSRRADAPPMRGPPPGRALGCLRRPRRRPRARAHRR